MTVQELYRLYETLAGIAELEPAPRTNAVFSELVALTTRADSEEFAGEVLADPLIQAIAPRLRQLCADGESRLERAWARRIAASAEPGDALRRQFPYYENYQRLTRLESHAVTGLAKRPPPRRVLVIGSGPLPLTSLMLAGHYGQTVDNLDIDPEAVALATRLADTLGIGGLRFICTDALSVTDLVDYDLVLLAAMVGSDRGEKTTVIRHLYDHMPPSALLLARSSHSLRTLLYPRVGVEDLDSFVPLAELHPHTDVVNSVLVAQKPAEQPPLR